MAVNGFVYVRDPKNTLIEEQNNGGSSIDTESDSDSEPFTYEDLWLDHHNGNNGLEATNLSDCLNQSFENNEVEMEFYSTNESVMIRCQGKEYHVGAIDLTEVEHSKLQQINEVSVQLTIHSDHIKIDRHNVLNIQRIKERVVEPDSNFAHNQLSAAINLVRIQFSESEPLLARYNDTIYTVGPRLHSEYVELMDLTTKPFGTIALKLNKKRIICDDANRIIDVTTSQAYAGQKICIINGCFKYDDQFLNDWEESCDGFSRFIINHKPDVSFEKVDVKLLFASDHDDCDEIYAEQNYPFNEYPAEKEDCKSVATVTKKMLRMNIKSRKSFSEDDDWR